MNFKIAAFYKFLPLENPAATQATLKQSLSSLGLLGSLLVAPEGINGTLAGTGEAIDALIELLEVEFSLLRTEIKFSTATEKPFNRLKVRLKREIITFGQPHADPSKQTGIYVDPQDWNSLINDPDILVLDTRNSYETALGMFAGATDPDCTTFTSLADFVHANLDPAKDKKVAMYCTGGIRCEKASSFLLQEGFSEVYQLKGGILKYLEVIPESQSLWHGDCYVFDKRMAVGPGLKSGHYAMCYSCGCALSSVDCEDSAYESGVSCANCLHETTTEDKTRFRMRHNNKTGII